MLNRSSLNAAFPLAQMLAGRNIHLDSVAESRLGKLVDTSLVHAKARAYVDKNTDAFEGVEEDFNNMLLEGSMHTDPSNYCHHDALVAESVASVGKAVETNLHIARNIVNPMVKRVVDNTQRWMDERAKNAVAPLIVVPFFYKEIWNSPILLDLVNRYASTPPADIKLRPLNIAKPASFAEALLSGAGRFDEEITAFIQNSELEYIDSIWHSVFGASPTQTILPLLNNRVPGVDAAIIVFLLARRYMEDIPEGVNMSPAEWKAYIADIMAQAGLAICRINERRQINIKTKVVVFSAPNGERPMGDVFVNGEVYNQWLNDGGSPEILFGSIFTGRNFGYVQMLEAKEENLKAWRKINSILQSEASFNRFRDFIDGLARSVNDEIRDFCNTENEQYKDLMGLERDNAVLSGRVKELLKGLIAKDADCLYDSSRRVVCRSMFPNTDAEKILLAIDASAKAHPELDLREAALLAVIDYMGDWLFRMMNVSGAE